MVALAVLAVACGDNGDDAGAEEPEATPAAFVQPTVVPPACDGTGISDIERSGERSFTEPPEMVIDPAMAYVAEMQTTRGVITIELASSLAPVTVNNFVFLSCTGYYDGLTFHRVVSAPHVIQGGDPRGDGRGGPGYSFEDEFSDELTHEAGVISMANSGPNTNGSQFFITLGPEHHLDGAHSVFGHVTDGMNVAGAIRQGDVILAVSISEAAGGS